MLNPLKLALVRLGRRTATSAQITPPLGILSLAAYLRQHQKSLELTLVDQRLDDCTLDEITRRAAGFGADIIGLSLLTPSAHALPELTRSLRAALPKALIVLGGPHVTAFGTKSLEGNQADAAVSGEGELAFNEIVSVWRDSKDFSAVPGLIWRDKQGDIILNPGCFPWIEDLDTLPVPAFDLIDPAPYWRLLSHAHMPPRRYAAMHTSRGCPYQCIYCHRVFGKRFRQQSPERIIDEIEFHQRTYGLREIEFLDDTFNCNQNHVFAFSDLVRARGINIGICFPNGLRADIITEETADALKSAGLYFSCLALESGSPRVQKLIEKHLNIERFFKTVDLFAARRIFTNGFNMLGFPTETRAEMEQTISLTCQSQLHTASFFTVTPFPNTKLHEMAAAIYPERVARIRYDDMDYSHTRINFSNEPDAVLFACQRYAWRRFYTNPKRILRILRDYPHPWFLMRFAPMLGTRLTKGIFR